MTTKNNKKIPVNVYPVKKQATDKWRSPREGETDFVYGEHQPHHATCPDRQEFVK